MQKKTNVLIVLLDGCRADRLGCYGYKQRKTSLYLDRCAEGGMIALNHYSTSNCTLPAVVSMMTGVYPSLHKASSTFCYYDGAYPFLTDILRDSGYYTFGITNNLVSMSPEWGFVRGYDKYYRIGKNHNWFKESKEEQRGVRSAPLDVRIKRMIMETLKIVAPSVQAFLERRSQLKHYYAHDMGGIKAVETLGQALNDRDQEKPFFGYINLPDTHHPYFVPHEHFNPSPKLMMSVLNPTKFLKEQHSLNDKDKEMLSYMYDRCVNYVDNLCRKIDDILVSMNLKDSTLIVFTSDHGGMLAERNNWVGGKYHLFEPEVKTVCILKGRDIKGVKTQVSSAIDVFPTILDYLGLDIPNSINGISLFSNSAHDAVLLDSPRFPSHMLEMDEINFMARVLITKDLMKIIYENGSFKYLFDLKNDPMEQNNLISDASADYLKDCMINKYKELGIIDLGEYVHNNMVNLPKLSVVNPGFREDSLIYV